MANSMTAQLHMLKPGATGIIKAFAEEDGLTDQLREMGFAEDISIEIMHESPIGKDPMVVQVGAMIIALRRQEAAHIFVQLTD